MKQRGFTLIEMLLVLVVVSAILYIVMGYLQQQASANRISRASAQMQQILNAGMSYYVGNGHWPSKLDCLQGDDKDDSTCKEQYIPEEFPSPYGADYKVYQSKSLFYVYLKLKSSEVGQDSLASTANTIAGSLPLSYVSGDSSFSDLPDPGKDCGKKSNTCYVVTSVNIPGQNLNNASAVNFAGVYHDGSCVPVPKCPVDQNGNTMTPEIVVSPVSVSGLYDKSNPDKVYPISSFTAYATSTTSKGGVPTDDAPLDCEFGKNEPCQGIDSDEAKKNNAYWRVCLQIITVEGEMPESETFWHEKVTLMAITRCSIKNESKGTTYIFTP